MDIAVVVGGPLIAALAAGAGTYILRDFLRFRRRQRARLIEVGRRMEIRRRVHEAAHSVDCAYRETVRLMEQVASRRRPP